MTEKVLNGKDQNQNPDVSQNQPAGVLQPQQLQKPVEVMMELTERGLLQSAKQLYSERLSFLREAFQNASDSKATEFSVDISKQMIIIKDNGSGMSYDFMKNEFNNIGKRFKDNEGNIGQYGIGRLSFWSLIAEEKKGAVVYNGHVEIYTCNGDEQTNIVWKNLANYEIAKSEPKIPKGTEVRIVYDSARLFGPMLAQSEAIRYLSKNIVSTSLQIKVNNYSVDRAQNVVFETKSSTDFINTTTLAIEKHTYRCSYTPELQKIIVAEKGIKATEIIRVNASLPAHGRGYKEGMLAIPHGGIIDFGNGASANHEKSILPLGREDILLYKDSVVLTFYRDAVLPYYSGMEEAGLMAHRSEILDIFYFIHLLNVDLQLATEFNKLILLNGQRLAELAKGSMVVWTMKSDRFTAEAQGVGYTIIDANGDVRLAAALEAAGIKSVEERKKEIRSKFKVRTAQSPTEKHGLEALAGYMTYVETIAKKAIGNLDSWIGDLEREEAERAEEGKRIEIDPSELPGYVTMLGPGINQGGISLYLAEHANSDVKVFAIKKKNGNAIAINVNNDFVRMCLDTRRMDLLVPEVVFVLVSHGGTTDREGIEDVSVRTIGPLPTLLRGIMQAVVAGQTSQNAPLGKGETAEERFNWVLIKFNKMLLDLQTAYTSEIRRSSDGKMLIPQTELDESSGIAPGTSVDVVIRSDSDAEDEKERRKRLGLLHRGSK